jgi:uncharacterized membrane-anchored protein
VSRLALRLWIAAAAALVLAVVSRSIAAKERIRHDGAVVYLELRPLDPRSLMQGDYMALRFALADEIEQGPPALASGVAPRDTAPFRARTPVTGEGGWAWAPIRLDDRGVATLAAEGDPQALLLRYRIRGGRPWLGTNAFFFPEGKAERFAPAQFGEFRLDRVTGEAVLVGLRDGQLRPL